METFEICVPRPSGPLAITVSVVPAEDAGWLEAEIIEAIWRGLDPYKLLKWLPECLEHYADEVEFWPDLGRWRWQDKGHPVNVNAYRAIVRPGR
jgi:hypothetical protein